LIHMIFSAILATASYSLALSSRDYYLFGLQLILAPMIFFLLNDQSELNNWSSYGVAVSVQERFSVNVSL